MTYKPKEKASVQVNRNIHTSLIKNPTPGRSFKKI